MAASCHSHKEHGHRMRPCHSHKEQAFQNCASGSTPGGPAWDKLHGMDRMDPMDRMDRMDNLLEEILTPRMAPVERNKQPLGGNMFARHMEAFY